MNPSLVNLVASANNIFGHTLDARQRAYAYLLAKAAGGIPLDAASIKALVQDFPGYNDEMHLNVKIYQLMLNTGLSTDFRTLMRNTINPVWLINNGIEDSQDVLNIIKYARLRQLGAI